MKRLLIALGTIIISIVTAYSKEQLIYTSISKNEGLTSTVNCIYKEKDGEVWIGSPKGLYSFNGHILKHHKEGVLEGCRVNMIRTDKDENLWLATSKGIIFCEYGESTFHLLKGSESQVFHSIWPDEDTIWFGGAGCIYRYSRPDKELRLLSRIADLPNFTCKHLFRLDDTTLIGGSHNGIISIDVATGTVTGTLIRRATEISAMMSDSNDRIWIAYYNQGIEVFRKDGTSILKYDTSNSSLSNDIVLCMTEKDGRIWAGTDGGGVNIIDPETGEIKVLSHISGDSSSFPAHSIKSIYTDSYGDIWAGSIREGLIHASFSNIQTYSDSHLRSESGLSNPTVLCIYQDKGSDYIWIGTDGEGINRFDPQTRRFRHYESTFNKKIVSIARYSDTELALSSYSDRIWLFNTSTGAIRPLESGDKNLEYGIKYSGISYNLANSSDGNLLLITNSLRRYDKRTGKIRVIPSKDRKNANDNLFIIGRSDDGLWLHDRTGIYFLENGASSFNIKGELGGCTISSGHFGNDNDIWLATDDGLYRYEISTGNFTSISSPLFAHATSAVCDNLSRVWVGTENGLFAYLPEKKFFCMFGTSDGAAPNEYLSKPHHLSSNGDIYMGGVQGLLRIDSEYRIDRKEEPELRLDYVISDNENIKVGNSGVFSVPRNNSSVSIGVYSQEKDMFRHKMYRFQLSKAGTTYETYTPVLTLHQMPEAGKHDLLVSCMKRNGEWTEPKHILTLAIPQPWYKTWWFIGGTLFLLFLMILTWVSASLKRKENRLMMALKEKDEAVNQEKISLLINMSHELRTPLTLIMAPLKRLLKEMSPDQEHYASLNRIYRQSRRMTGLLNMVLDLRKMETGNEKLNIERQDLNRWILETSEDIANEEMTEDISIRYDLSPDITEVDFDKKKCDTVFMNILMNAIKHSRSGDTITVKTETKDDCMVRVSISDQGPGIIGLDIDRLFTPFYQSDKEKHGSGIGLSYSKILVELHGGRIGAENNYDKGATFWWEIPIKYEGFISTEVPARSYLNELMGYEGDKDEEAPDSENFNTGNMTLMLVDDNKDLLEFLREALCSDFCDIILAESGNQAMALLSSGKLPDIIVSDVNMPDGNGYRLCKDVKSDARYSHIPVILLASRGEGQIQSNSYRMGADAFLAKPFEIEILTEAIRGLLKKRAEIRRKYLDSKGTDVSEYGSNEESFIMKLNGIIGQHIDDPALDQQLLCRELGISRALLYNKMKAIVGTGTKEYVTKIRLEKAKHLIETTKMPVAEIAEKTGFTSQAYFSTAFKNYTGVTPSQYRQNIGKQS